MHQDDLTTLLFALAHGELGTARALVDEREDDAGLRDRMRAALDTDGTAAARCRALGDAIRRGGTIDFQANECYRAAFYLGDGLDELREDSLFGYFSSARSGRTLDKWVHYFPVYSQHFARFRHRASRILEIGVYRGGSLQMWRHFFGPEALIVGADIDPACRAFATDLTPVEIGDQQDPEFLLGLVDRYGPFDLVIDDGGHFMEQQIVTAQTLFPTITEGGAMLVEDTHTSYWPAWGGTDNAAGSFVEWAMARVHDLHAYHRAGPVDSVWHTDLAAMHWYDSVVVFDKAHRFAPFAEQVGASAYLHQARDTAQVISELIAGRDAARTDLDALRTATAQQTESELVRQLGGELTALRGRLASLEAELDRRTPADAADGTDTVGEQDDAHGPTTGDGDDADGSATPATTT